MTVSNDQPEALLVTTQESNDEEETVVSEHIIEAVSVRNGDVVCDATGNVWRFDDRDIFRWTDFTGHGLSRDVPPGPLTLLVRDGRPVAVATRTAVLNEAWQAVDRAVRPLGTECGQSRWNAGYTQARNEAENAILALRDA